MGLLGQEEDKKQMVITQISIGGFDQNVSAKELTKFLESNVGMVWRCRLKKSWTPPDSYPDIRSVDLSRIPMTDDYNKVAPHAFVHFARPEAAMKAINASGCSKLLLNGDPLRVNSSADSSFQIKLRRATDPFEFPDVCFEIGTLLSPGEFMASWKGPQHGVHFVVDPFYSCCKIFFTKDVTFSFKDSKGMTALKCELKVEFLVREIVEIGTFKERAPFTLLMRLTSSPLLYYRTADDDISVTVPFNLLDDEDPWIRTTDFTPGGVIGKCNSYKISLSPRYGPKLGRAMAYLKQRRIADLSLKQELKVKYETEFVPLDSDGLEPFFCLQHQEGISFDLTFLLNALLHKGVINRYQMNVKVFNLLRSGSPLLHETALRHIYSYRWPIFDLYNRLKMVEKWLMNNPKLLIRKNLPVGNVEVRKLIITPTRAYCLPPEVELSNRVLRKYKDVSDRFMRLTFTDEGMQQINSNALTYHAAPIVREITSYSYPQKTTIFQRVKSILTKGFRLCGRRYSFLAFSSNQLRDRSAWFFADGKGINARSIRAWMGKFYNKNVAKCAARMGQCFSSTYATVDVPSKKVQDLEDIERNDYVFSDGIGMISPDLALEVAKKLQLLDNLPSAYQIRYGGYKGVVAVWTGNDDGFQLRLRPSMNKFESDHTILEVVSWTRFQPGFLNRQIVTLLSALGVADDVFDRMQDSMIQKLNCMLVDIDVAFEVLTTSCAEQGNTAAMMLSAGFTPQTEPHLKGMLACLRSAQLGDLLSKTRIFVSSGRWMMGCLDELGVLEHGQCFIQASTPSLESCFSKHGARFSDTKDINQIIRGTVAIAKNPCLHPGDVRILEAVDAPGLHHLVDCLIFPQKGERPHANEASGSDLDGDLYFVTWDENLIPPSKRAWPPMAYTPAEEKKLPRDVTSSDIIDFFTKNMVNENLGVICNAHVVHADLSEYGALDEKCLHLSELAAIAVDFPKTGKIVSMPHSLRPKIYPDFMGKEEYKSYKSEKILGKLYRKIKDASSDDVSSADLQCTRDDIQYDMDLEVPGSSQFITEAWDKKCIYDGQLNALLGQYKIKSEGEIVTGHFWSLPKYNSRKQGDLKERLKNAYSSLNKDFRWAFETMEQENFHQLKDEEKCALYEQKASAWYQVTYHPSWVKRSTELKEPDGDEVPIRLSFGWIAADYLVRIKVRHHGKRKLDPKRPADALASYLSDKMQICSSCQAVTA